MNFVQEQLKTTTAANIKITLMFFESNWFQIKENN